VADERLNNIKSQEGNATRLLNSICDLENVIGRSDFKANAQEVQELFNTLRLLNRNDKPFGSDIRTRGTTTKRIWPADEKNRWNYFKN
jgi:hypothetical protein